MDESTQIGWVTLGEARGQWSDAPLDDAHLADLLDASYEQCLAYAPLLGVDQEVPSRYRLAQLDQARNLYRTLKTGDGGQFGGEEGIVVFPLNWHVKRLLRPQKGVPVVG